MHSFADFLLILFALVFEAVGVFLLIVAHSSPWGLGAGSFFCVLAPCLAIPARIGPALKLLMSAVPDSITGKFKSNA